MRTPEKSRRFDRFPFKGTVALWQGRQHQLLPVSDLSAGGVFLRTDAPLGEGALYTLRVTLPGQAGFTVLSRVVRNQAGRRPLKTQGVALEFLDISPRDRARLRDFVTRLSGFAAAV